MNLFKQRIKELFLSVVVAVGIVGVLYGFIKLLELIYAPLPTILALLMLLSFVVYGVGSFIYWLFIEPFRKGKTK